MVRTWTASSGVADVVVVEGLSVVVVEGFFVDVVVVACTTVEP